MQTKWPSGVIDDDFPDYESDDEGNENENVEQTKSIPVTAEHLKAADDFLGELGGGLLSNTQLPSQNKSTFNPPLQTETTRDEMFSDINTENIASNAEGTSHLPQSPLNQAPRDQEQPNAPPTVPQSTADAPMEEEEVHNSEMKPEDGQYSAAPTSSASNFANVNPPEFAWTKMKEQQPQAAQQPFSFGSLFAQQQVQRDQEAQQPFIFGDSYMQQQMRYEQDLFRSQQEAQMEALRASELEASIARNNDFWNAMANLGASCPPKPPMFHVFNPPHPPPTPEEQEEAVSRSHLENSIRRERLERRAQNVFRYTAASSKGPGAYSFLHRNMLPMETDEKLSLPRIAPPTPIPTQPKPSLILRQSSRIYGTPRIRKLYEAARLGNSFESQESLEDTETTMPTSTVLGKRRPDKFAATSEKPSKRPRIKSALAKTPRERGKAASRMIRFASPLVQRSPSPSKCKKSEPTAGAEPRSATPKDSKKSSSRRRESRRKADDAQRTAAQPTSSPSKLGKRRREDDHADISPNATPPEPAPTPTPAPLILPFKRIRTSKTTFKYAVNDQFPTPPIPNPEPPQPASSVSTRQEIAEESQPRLADILQKEKDRIKGSFPSLLASISGFFRFGVRPSSS